MNFPEHHRRPRGGDSCTLALRYSDRIATWNTCIACEGEGGIFMGWIIQSHQHVLRKELEQGRVLKGEFLTANEFNWTNGGGVCIRCQILIL